MALRRNVVLEVERKFSRLRTYPLIPHLGSPPFHSLVHLGVTRFRDVYFDRGQQLSRSGMWLRQRDGVWQSKIKSGGDYTNSQFRETTDYDEIFENVRSITRKADTAMHAFGLDQVADITTARESWKADDKFKIVLDTTDFGHTVGEVELEASVMAEPGQNLTQMGTAMDHEIAAFLHRYHWAFDCENPIGKLTAYFTRQTGSGKGSHGLNGMSEKQKGPG